MGRRAHRYHCWRRRDRQVSSPRMLFIFPQSQFMRQRWWDLRSRKLTTSINFPNPVTSMEHSSQTNRIVVTSGKTVSFIPALPNGSQTHSLTLNYAPSSASIHPILQDRFVTGCITDEWVRIHDITGEERDILKGHHGPVHCVEFSPDGQMFASGSGKWFFSFFDLLRTETITVDH